ncbi:L,D-transpeptidase family protein [Parendozoicomonas haliclonae]|uniref:L,D-transpeptidase family protein n=1 Tax=Parendozoicomonas haliclonae TaxID=1960125 RepID=UPI003BF9D34B
MAIAINISAQQLTLTTPEKTWHWPVSTGARGAGQEEGSWQTPLGRHFIRARIGEGLDPYAVYRARRPTGECWTPELHASQLGRDWILGRILWLCGDEPGFNRHGNVDTQRRFIYIHGTPDSEPMGIPASHGCIRMRCSDLVELFPLTTPGMPVTIHL